MQEDSKYRNGVAVQEHQQYAPGNPEYDKEHQEFVNGGIPNAYAYKSKRRKKQPEREIVAVRMSEDGILTHFKLDDGTVLSKDQAVEFAEEFGIKGVNVGKTRGEDHTKILRSNPTDDPSKALKNLPRF